MTPLHDSTPLHSTPLHSAFYPIPAQDVITCDVCDKPTQQFCNSCQANLCDTCVKKQRDQFNSLPHDIVPFLDRKVQLAFPECQEHSGQRCEVNCKECDTPVCVKCIGLGPHKGHDVEELTEIYEKKNTGNKR